MKTLILHRIPLLLLIIWTGFINAQTISTTAGSVTSCPGEIVVPITVTNCNSIGAISLLLNFDNTKLTYSGYQNLNPELNGGLMTIYSSGNQVVIGWARTTAANLGNSTLVDLRFNATPSTTSLVWDTQTPGNCEYSDVNGVTLAATFVNGTETINQPPIIGGEPVDKSVLVGQNTSFSVSATGTAIAYLWQYSTNGGNTWADLANNATYSGVTTPTLDITNCLLGYNGYKYKCRLTGTCTPVIYTNVVTLYVINPITSTLPTGSFCPGNIVVPVKVTNFTGVASFSLAFSYSPTVLTYTGFQNLNGALSGGNFVANASNGMVYMTWSATASATFTNDTLVKLLFTAATGSSGLTWDLATTGNCEYSDSNGLAIATNFVNGNETIYGKPAVTVHPTDKIIAQGQNTSFSVTASASGIGYLWQVSINSGSTFTDLTNTAPYSNVTTPTLNITNAQLSISTYQYRCKISGTCTPIVYSNPAVLTVLPNILTACGTTTVCPGQVIVPINVTDFIGVASFSLALNYNPAVLNFTGYQNLNIAVAAGMFTTNAVGGKVYLTWSNNSAATIATAGLLVELKFTGITGTSSLTWDTQTTGNCEYSDINGLVIFSTWTNGNITINQPPALTNQPVNQSIYAGGSTSFSVAATGTSVGYHWQFSTNGGTNWTNLTNVSPYLGVNSATLGINPAAVGMNGYLYQCVVSGTCTPSVISNTAQLTVTQAAITTTSGTISNSCTGNLLVPIIVTNCSNVGSISLTMVFDTTKMVFDGYQSANAALTGGLLVVNRSANKVYLTWASTTAANLGTGVLIQYRFKSISGISTSLNWDTQTTGACEYSDVSGAVITSFYVNSNISVVANALIVDAGMDLSMSPGSSVQLNGTATGGSTPYTYLWTPSTGLNNPAISNPLASPTETTTYTLTVTGNNVCSGSDLITVAVASVAHTLNIKVLLEGLYDGPNAMQQAKDANGPHFGVGIADRIDVELHSAANYSQIVYTANNVDLLTNGQATITVPGNYSASYFLTIKHRNSIETTSANAVSFSAATISYFFDSPSKAYGNNLKTMAAGQYVVYGGDINQDGLVNTLDIVSAESQSSSFGSGYIEQDVNGDAVVDALDLILIDNNAAGFVMVKKP